MKKHKWTNDENDWLLINYPKLGPSKSADYLGFVEMYCDFLDIMKQFFCECFSNSMEIFTKKLRICKKCCTFTKV